MNVTWTAEEILRATNGRSLHAQDWQARGVAIDSRTTNPGDLFIAIKGDAFDGHEFVAKAFAAGAAAAIVQREPRQVAQDAPLVFVEDCFAALQACGRAGRARAQGKIVAVTGSVGKTSSKEMLRLMLGVAGDTYANEGSLNNHWGVPLSLARLPAQARYGIFEIGMNHAGELAPLSRDVQPHVALITNVEAVHLEYFASEESIAEAKAEIFEGLDASGIAVLNRDNRHYDRLTAAARARGIKKVLGFGHTAKSDAQILSLTPEEKGTTVEALILGQKLTYRVGAPGAHLALNALGALLACAAAGADPALCAEALPAYRTPTRRGTRETVLLPGGGTMALIDETFNASPVATKAAIAVLGDCDVGAGRRIVALGEMRELGPTAPALHASLAESLCAANVARVHCCGELTKALYDALPETLRGHWAADSAALAPLVAAEAKAGDVTMVKGSKSTHMELVVAALRACGEPLRKTG